MSAAILPFRAAVSPLPRRSAPARAGAASVGFAVRDGATRLVHLHQCAPLRVLFPYPSDDDIPVAAIANTGGGVLAGDRSTVTVDAGGGARVLAMPQAAEKVYRSEGPTAEIDTRLSVGAGSWLEWLPQETIVFQDARFRRATTLTLHREARAMAGEILVFGRIAHGERTTHGLVREAWQVRRDARLVWADALHLEGEFGATMARPANFDGAAAAATFVYGAPDAADRLDFARVTLDETAGSGMRTGMTGVAGLLVGRWLAADPLALRRAFGAFWAAFRSAVAGLPRKLPALWHV